MKWLVLIVVGLVLLGLGLTATGVAGIVKRETDERAKATITECRFVDGGGKTISEECTGTWTVGGSLLGKGHVVIGEVDGAESKDLHKTIDVRVSGDHAYTTSLAIPIVLIGLGLLFLLGAWFAWWVGSSGSTPTTTLATPAPAPERPGGGT